MPETYPEDRMPGIDEPVTITRQCSEYSGCGEDIEITLNPDGSYDGGHFFSVIDSPTDGAYVVNQTYEYDEWIDKKMDITWSETEEREFWLHDECAKPEDYEPGEGTHRVHD